METNKPELSYFLAQIGHEIRTPLNGIKGFGDLLLEETFGPLNEKQKLYLGKMLKNSDQLLAIVNQILDWAKLDSGQMILQQETVNLSHVLHETASLVELRVQEKKINLEIDVPQEPLLIQGDYGRIREIILNLVSNALKFTDAGGKICLIARNEGNEKIVQIRDNGVGIAKDYREKIFQPFARGIDRPGEEKSVGLGLWICKSLMELHQGTIEVESEEGQGTTFTLRF